MKRTLRQVSWEEAGRCRVWAWMQSVDWEGEISAMCVKL